MNDKKIKEVDLSLFKTNPNIEFEKCQCSCHNSEFMVMHFMPCCNICKYCEQRIDILSYEEHIEVCKKITVSYIIYVIPCSNRYNKCFLTNQRDTFFNFQSNRV